MSRRRRSRKAPAWVLVAAVLVIGLVLGSLLWAALIVAILYVLWLIPARQRPIERRRVRAPRGWGSDLEDAGRKRVRD
jgi:uncharacterized protein (DUF58 family)